jgi:serine/threonine-protein kinase RsbW
LIKKGLQKRHGRVVVMEIKVVLSLPRDAASVPVTRRVLDSCLTTLGVKADTRADIALALTEACGNVIRHAGPGDDYEVTARTADGRCVIEVRDTGAGAAQTGGNGHALDATTLSESGRGLKIMSAVVDDLTLTGTRATGTTVHFEKALDWTPGALAEPLFEKSA